MYVIINISLYTSTWVRSLHQEFKMCNDTESVTLVFCLPYNF